MAANLEDKLAGLPRDRRAKVDARAAELIAEELTLRDLRRALERTQINSLTNWASSRRPSEAGEAQRHAPLDAAQLVKAMGGESI